MGEVEVVQADLRKLQTKLKGVIVKYIKWLYYWLRYNWSKFLVRIGLRKPYFQKSVRSLRKIYFKPTKAYADQRQKATWNRKKKLSKAMKAVYHG